MISILFDCTSLVEDIVHKLLYVERHIWNTHISLIVSKLFTNLKRTENNRAKAQEVLRSVEIFQLIILQSYQKTSSFNTLYK
jgi:hypothetical protein